MIGLLEIELIVEQLNTEIYTQIEHDEVMVTVTSTGFGIMINFLNIELWNSEDDGRSYLDEENDIMEDLEMYLRSRIVEEINVISTIDLGIDIV